jgi:RNA polymerase sigma-B factor
MSIAVPPARTSAHPGDPPADKRLLCRYAATRAPPDRERLVVRYLPLARFAANHYARDPDAFDDLMQVASVGLLKAIDRFDPENGASFPSYALPTMFGELRRHFRDHSWAVRPPRTLLEQALQVERATTALTEALGRSPAVDEVAAHTGLSCEQVLDAREAAVAHTATSLSAPVGDGDGDAVELGTHLGSDDTGYAHAEDRATVTSLTRVLSLRDREIVRLRLEEDLTQREIGERVGLSQMHVSRILRDALRTLRLAAAT